VRVEVRSRDGLSRDAAKIDVRLKSAAPFLELCRWSRYDSEKRAVFKKRYFAELDGDKQAANEVLQYMENSEATLRHAAKVVEYNHAVALLG
jgi:uncharacterized protein YeaO (DUF488 family)